MTGRRIAALLGVPVLLAAAWGLGGAVVHHPPVDLGSVVMVGPASGDQPGSPAAPPPIGTPTVTGDPSTPDPSPPPPATATAPVSTPMAPAAPAAGATRVSGEPAPAAGENDDDDGIEDGGIDDSITDDDYDEGVVDDDTDS